MAVETPVRLDKAKVCLSCGRNSFKVAITRDHAMPQALLGPKSSRFAARENPLFPVVYQVSNLFPLCSDEHSTVDSPKLEAFFGAKLYKLEHNEMMKLIHDPERGYPQNLIAWLAKYYPITTSSRLRGPQIARLQVVMDTFIAVAGRSNVFPEYTDSYRKKFEKAVQEAEAFNRKLRGLESPPIVVDMSTREAV